MRIEIVYFATLLYSAYGDNSDCDSLLGTCQDVQQSCTGAYVYGICTGSSNIQCCTPLVNDQICVFNGGTCQHESCPGEQVPLEGLACIAPPSVQCCRPVGADSPCLDKTGTCQDDLLPCSGEYVSGLCSGASNRRCCIAASGMCFNVKVYSRATWGARHPKSVTTMPTPASLFFVHHTEGNYCHDFTSCSAEVRSIQNYHMDSKGWLDIAYSFLVGEDGAVYEGRGWEHVGSHTRGYNSRGFAASVMGNFMHRKPNDAALDAVQNLILCGVFQNFITFSYRLYGHRDVSNKTCPGDAFYDEIKTWPFYSTVRL